MPFEGFSLGSIFPSDVLRGNEQSLNTQKKPRKIKVFDFFLFNSFLTLFTKKMDWRKPNKSYFISGASKRK